MAGVATALGVIGLGASIGSAIGGAMHAKRVEKAQAKLTKAQLDAAAARQKYLDETFGRPLTGAGAENLNMVQNELRRRASGDRSATLQAMAPEINGLLAQNQGAVGAQRSLFQRGGTTASQAANIPNQLQGNINNLMFSGRQQALGALGTLGQNQSSLGLAAMGQGAGLTNSMLQYGLDARRLQMEQGMALGQGVGGFLQLAQQLYGNKPSTTTNNNPYLPTSPPQFSQGDLTPGTNSTLGGQSTPSSQSYNPYQSPGRG